MSAELSQKRRAIYAALSSHLSPEQTLWALCLWRRDYSERPSFALREFTQQLAKALQLPGEQRGELHKEMVRALFLDPSELGADPQSDMERHCAELEGQQPSPVFAGDGELPESVSEAQLAVPLATPEEERGIAQGSAADAVFAIVVRALFATLSTKSKPIAEGVRQRLLGQLPKLDLSEQQTQALNRWLPNLRGECPTTFKLEERRRLLHEIYVLIAHQFGPTSADRLLAEAIEQAEKRPEAAQFAPRQLL